MNEMLRFFVFLIVMVAVTYLLRAVPMVLFRGNIKSRFVRSLLAYVPYTVLAAMTFPTIIHAPGNAVYGAVAAAVCIILALLKRGVVTVAAGGALAVLACSLVSDYLIPLL